MTDGETDDDGTDTVPRSRRAGPPTASEQLEALLGYPWPFPGRPPKHDLSIWTVTDDWSDPVPVTESEIEIFERWFGDLFDEFFGPDTCWYLISYSVKIIIVLVKQRGRTMPGLKVGIRDAGDSREAMPGDPTVWFPSTESFARLLTAENRRMLRLIAERSPQSLDELVELTGRAKPNLSRSLHRLADCGIVRVERNGRKLVPTLLCDHIELILPLTGHELPGTTAIGDRA